MVLWQMLQFHQNIYSQIVLSLKCATNPQTTTNTMNIVDTFYFFTSKASTIWLHSHPLVQHYYSQISLIPIAISIPSHQLVFRASSTLIHFIAI